MNRRLTNPLPALVESFFRGYLQRIRAASPHTVRAYRDTLKLFFTFLVQDRSVAELRLEDLQVDHVVRFLRNLEEVRKNGRATRNCRLTALRSFFGHLLRHDPTRAEQYNRVLAIPSKKHAPSCASYLEPEEVRVILAQPDRSTRWVRGTTRSCSSSTTLAQDQRSFVGPNDRCLPGPTPTGPSPWQRRPRSNMSTLERNNHGNPTHQPRAAGKCRAVPQRTRAASDTRRSRLPA